VKLAIIIAIAFVLLIPIPISAQENINIVLKYVEKQELENSNLAIVEIFVINNSYESMNFENSFSLIDSKNTSFQMMSQETEIALNNECMTSIPVIPSRIPTVLKLCFELPKINEDFVLQVNHEEFNTTIHLYLETHNVKKEFSSIDFRKVYLTINDVKIKKSNIGDIVIVDMFIYNGYFSEGKHGMTNITLEPEAGRFYILDSNNIQGKIVWDVHLTGSIAEECKEPDKVNSGTFEKVQICFKRPIGASGSFSSELFLRIQESWNSGCTSCQKKIFELNPYLNTVNEESIQKIPDWVKNIFGWYSQDQVSEDELLNTIKYLINEKILIVN